MGCVVDLGVEPCGVGLGGWIQPNDFCMLEDAYGLGLVVFMCLLVSGGDCKVTLENSCEALGCSFFLLSPCLECWHIQVPSKVRLPEKRGLQDLLGEVAGIRGEDPSGILCRD